MKVVIDVKQFINIISQHTNIQYCDDYSRWIVVCVGGTMGILDQEKDVNVWVELR